MSATEKLSGVVTRLLHESRLEERSALLTLDWTDWDTAPRLHTSQGAPLEGQRVVESWTPTQVRFTYRRASPRRPWYVSAEVRGLDTGLGQPTRTWASLQTMPGWLVDCAKRHAPGGELA